MTVVDKPEDAQSTKGPPSSGGGSAIFVAMIAITVLLVGSVVVIGLIGLLTDIGSDDSSVSGSSTIDVSLTEFAITGDLTAPAGEVSLNVTNGGTMDHNLAEVDLDVRTAMLPAGQSATLDLGDLAPGTYTLICEVPGHASSGMTAELVITDGSGAGSGDTTGDTTGGTSEAGADYMTDPAMAAQMDKTMLKSFLPFPAATEGVGNEPLEFKLMPDGTKQFELTAAITPWEVEPGKIVDAWTYNGTAPGPQIKVDVGDKVRVIIHNDTPLGTDIHWHGIDTPFTQDGVSPITQDPISSGDTYTYEFLATEPANGMYHAHLHSQISVPNGMFGSFVIGENPIPRGQTIGGVTIPEDVVPAVDMPMVLNDAGVIGLSLNGKSFPATAPIVVNNGDWLSLTYLNEGLLAHPMHLHKFPQLVYAKDGFPLDQPYWADTINVAPGERYQVLVHADEVGTWVWHCHILNHVERETGMFGMLTALVVQ